MLRKALKKVFESLNAVTSTVRQEVWPALKSARLITIDGMLHGHAINGDCFLDVEINKTDFQADLLVPPKNVLAEIKGRKEEIHFAVGVAGIVVGEKTLPYQLCTEFPIPPEINTPKFQFDGSFIEAMAFVNKLDAKGNSHSTQGIVVSDGFYATDGFRIKAWKGHTPTTLNGKRIPSNAAQVVTKVLDSQKPVMMAVDEKTLYLEQDNVKIYVRLNATPYQSEYKVREYLSEIGDKPLICDKNAFLDLLKRIKDDEHEYCNLVYNDGTLTINASKDGEIVEYGKLPANYGKFNRWYNVDWLTEAIGIGQLSIPHSAMCAQSENDCYMVFASALEPRGQKTTKG